MGLHEDMVAQKQEQKSVRKGESLENKQIRHCLNIPERHIGPTRQG